MKRRSFLTGSMAGTLGAVALGATGDIAGVASSPVDDSLMITPAVVMAPREDGVEVVWAVSRLCRGWVECRPQGGEAVRHATDGFGLVPQGTSVMRVRLEGLKPGTAYELRAVVERGDGTAAREQTGWKPFRTLAPDAAEVKFVVWNDTHEHLETIKRLHAATPQADFLLWNGDTCNNWIREDLLIPTLLSPAGQDVSAGRPLFLTVGNHDVRGAWAFRLRETVAMPHGRPYYAFRHGPVAFICLHTGEDKPDDHPTFGGRVAFEPLRLEQAEWLEKVIERPDIKNAPQKVVFCHIPLRWKTETVPDYTKGGYDGFARTSREAWHAALVKWGAQVVISGHTHQDAWIPADEKFPYGQLVSGGPTEKAARWIEGTAGADGLRLVMRDLDGEITRDHTLPRI